jgi:hypothetical protein
VHCLLELAGILHRPPVRSWHLPIRYLPIVEQTTSTLEEMLFRTRQRPEEMLAMVIQIVLITFSHRRRWTV